MVLFCLSRRSKRAAGQWDGGGVAKTSPPVSGDDGGVAAVATLPKDDDTILRSFRAIDGRITDHVLSLYVVPSDIGGRRGLGCNILYLTYYTEARGL